jgi:Signal transduction histidine kinase
MNIIRQLDRSILEAGQLKLSIGLQDRMIERLAEKINKVTRKQEKKRLDILHQENELKQSIANISHDLRTPLTSIIGYLQLFHTGTEEQKERYLKIIEAKAQMLNSLVNRFYELSVIEANDYEMPMETVNITEVVTSVLVDHYVNFQNKNIKPSISLPDQRIEIWGNALSCERIIQNIISNAIRYSGEIFQVTLCIDNGYAVLTAKNMAPFLTEDDITHLFDRFYTGDKARDQGSTGIGLYIVKILLERMSGKLVETSLINHVFTLRIAFKLVETMCSSKTSPNFT